MHFTCPNLCLAFYWHQIFALDSVVVKTQKLLSSHGGFLTNAMHQVIIIQRVKHIYFFHFRLAREFCKEASLELVDRLEEVYC